MQVKVLFAGILLFLLWNCSNNNSAGFGSITTNGGTANIQLTGDSTYENAMIYVIPTNFNPTKETLPQERKFTVDSTGSALITIPDTAYNLYAFNPLTGNKALLTNAEITSDTLNNIAVSPPGNVKIHFKNSSSIIDTTKGFVYFPGYTDYKPLKGNITGTPDDYTILFDSIPTSIIDSLFYGTEGDHDYTQSLGSATVASNDTFDIYAKLLYRFITTKEYNIPSDTIYSIIRCKEQLWLSSPSGLSTVHEDAMVKESYTWCTLHDLPEVTSLISADEQTIYYSTNEGVFKTVFGKDENSYTTQIINEIGTIFDLEIDKMGALWIATNNGLYKTLNGHVKQFTKESNGFPSDTILTISLDSSGTLYGGTNNGLFLLYRDETSFTITKDMTPVMFSNKIRSIEVSPLNHVWIGTEGGGVMQFTKDMWYSYLPGYEHIYYNTAVTDIAFSAQGAVWVSTQSGLLLHGTQKGWNIFFGEKGIIPGYPIRSITVGKNSTIYCATEGAGVFVIGPSENFTKAEW